MPAIDLDSVLDQLVSLFTNPMSNIGAALALYGIVAIVVLIMLIGGVMLVLGGADDEVEAGAPEETSSSDDEPDETAHEDVEVLAEEVAVPPRTPRSRMVSAAIAVGVVAMIWAVTGYSTSNDAACAGCHLKSPHVGAEKARDPHAGTTCVACHEPGGVVSRALLGVPSRTLHVVGQLVGYPVSRDYGRVSRSACAACHGGDIAGVTTDAARGVRMSHKEPLAAGAACIDCHALRSGVLSAVGVGMNPCLRCHDAKTASSECGTCHDKKASAAARVRRVAPAVQIPDVSCGGCHDEKRDCDSCHGVRLPHSKEYMAFAHARAGAVDFWYNRGRTCAKCHSATRNPCTKCHSSMLGAGHGPSNAVSHQRAAESACASCHGQRAYMSGRDFCKDLCHSPVAIAASPR